MRLGQLARKYDISIQKIISYLEEIGHTNNSHHPNSKLDEQTEALVEKHFEHLLKVSTASNEELIQEEEQVAEPAKSERKIDTEEVSEVEMGIPINEENVEDQPLEGDKKEEEEETELSIEEDKPEEEVVSAVKEVDQVPEEENTIIETDQLLELMESEDNQVDLSKIKLIKAPKKELSGLKVVGKIDLPEPKTKTTEKSDEPENGERSPRNKKHQRQGISDEEREKRRYKARKRKEAYEKQQEERRKEKEKRAVKKLKKSYYEQKLKETKSYQQKQKNKYQKQSKSLQEQENQPEPKSALGRFWKWLNT